MLILFTLDRLKAVPQVQRNLRFYGKKKKKMSKSQIKSLVNVLCLFELYTKEKQHKGRTNYATVDILTCIMKKGKDHNLK